MKDLLLKQREKLQLTGPSMNRHRSKQDYTTPDNFMKAVYQRFGLIVFDLAASKQDTKAPSFFSEADNALIQDWDHTGNGRQGGKGNFWLNPPFNDIEPWAKKCSLTKKRVLFLTPASIGSNWFADYVLDRALVLALNPRLSFDGQHPYPKDCMLSCFNYSRIGFEVWRWK